MNNYYFNCEKCGTDECPDLYYYRGCENCIYYNDCNSCCFMEDCTKENNCGEFFGQGDTNEQFRKSIIGIKSYCY